MGRQYGGNLRFLPLDFGRSLFEIAQHKNISIIHREKVGNGIHHDNNVLKLTFLAINKTSKFSFFPR